MTDDTTNTGGASIVFDDWRTISFAVFLALVGYSVMVTVPVLSTALVHSLSFTEEQVGRVWGNDMLGFSVGAIIAAFSVARVNRRLLEDAKRRQAACPALLRESVDAIAQPDCWHIGQSHERHPASVVLERHHNLAVDLCDTGSLPHARSTFKETLPQVMAPLKETRIIATTKINQEFLDDTR